MNVTGVLYCFSFWSYTRHLHSRWDLKEPGHPTCNSWPVAKFRDTMRRKVRQIETWKKKSFSALFLVFQTLPTDLLSQKGWDRDRLSSSWARSCSSRAADCWSHCSSKPDIRWQHVGVNGWIFPLFSQKIAELGTLTIFWTIFQGTESCSACHSFVVPAILTMTNHGRRHTTAAENLKVQHDEHRNDRDRHPGRGHRAIDEEPTEGGKGKEDARHEHKPWTRFSL